jgi:hypothetical protein
MESARNKVEYIISRELIQQCYKKRRRDCDMKNLGIMDYVDAEMLHYDYRRDVLSDRFVQITNPTPFIREMFRKAYPSVPPLKIDCSVVSKELRSSLIMSELNSLPDNNSIEWSVPQLITEIKKIMGSKHFNCSLLTMDQRDCVISLPGLEYSYYPKAFPVDNSELDSDEYSDSVEYDEEIYKITISLMSDWNIMEKSYYLYLYSLLIDATGSIPFDTCAFSIRNAEELRDRKIAAAKQRYEVELLAANVECEVMTKSIKSRCVTFVPGPLTRYEEYANENESD